MDQRDFNNQPQPQPYNNQAQPQAYNYNQSQPQPYNNQPQPQPYNNQMQPQAYNYNQMSQPYNYENNYDDTPKLRFNVPGLIGMIIGIFGALSMFIPYTWVLAFFEAVAALILGIVGVNLKDRKKGMARASLIMGIIELGLLVLIIVVLVIFVLLFGSVGVLSEFLNQIN